MGCIASRLIDTISESVVEKIGRNCEEIKQAWRRGQRRCTLSGQTVHGGDFVRWRARVKANYNNGRVDSARVVVIYDLGSAVGTDLELGFTFYCHNWYQPDKTSV